ncbi:hypothetical protein [Advenella kashmirensis]|uniref:hypothetical protein n=1 Tax=Advenella kashmirensis TaxID=310575 RepID=UPI0014947420|nr:hypothetical protein [Advenella kashmirensis]
MLIPAPGIENSNDDKTKRDATKKDARPEALAGWLQPQTRPSGGLLDIPLDDLIDALIDDPMDNPLNGSLNSLPGDLSDGSSDDLSHRFILL